MSGKLARVTELAAAVHDRAEPSATSREGAAVLLRRPLLLALMLGAAVSVLGSGRFTLRLLVDGALSMAYPPVRCWDSPRCFHCDALPVHRLPSPEPEPRARALTDCYK